MSRVDEDPEPRKTWAELGLEMRRRGNAWENAWREILRRVFTTKAKANPGVPVCPSEDDGVLAVPGNSTISCLSRWQRRFRQGQSMPIDSQQAVESINQIKKEPQEGGSPGGMSVKAYPYPVGFQIVEPGPGPASQVALAENVPPGPGPKGRHPVSSPEGQRAKTVQLAIDALRKRWATDKLDQDKWKVFKLWRNGKGGHGLTSPEIEKTLDVRPSFVQKAVNEARTYFVDRIPAEDIDQLLKH